MLTTNTNFNRLAIDASCPLFPDYSENRAKPELPQVRIQVYHYVTDPDQWERDLIQSRIESGLYER